MVKEKRKNIIALHLSSQHTHTHINALIARAREEESAVVNFPQKALRQAVYRELLSGFINKNRIYTTQVKLKLIDSTRLGIASLSSLPPPSFLNINPARNNTSPWPSDARTLAREVERLRTRDILRK